MSAPNGGTPSVEYRSTLVAALLTSVAMNSVAVVDGRGEQFVVPAAPNSDSPSRWKDIRVITNRPSQMILDTATKVNTGGYLPRFLDWVASQVEGFTYEVRIEAVADVKPKKLAKYIAGVQARARRISFAYVEGGHIVSVMASVNGVAIRDWKKFIDTCGLVIGNGPKISKRLKEIVRLTRFFTHLDVLDIRTFEDIMGEIPQMHVDGATLISMSTALSMTDDPWMRKQIRRGNIRRVSIRIITPQGLIKGDALIVPNKNIPCDVFTSKHNVKGELRSKKGYILTMEPHHAASPAWSNDQVMSWFSGLFKLDQMRETVKQFLAETLEKLRAGEYPSHLVSLPEVKDGVDQIALFRMSSHKWLAHGLEINQTAALVKQAGNAVTKQLLSEPKIVTRYGKPWRDYTKQEVHVPITHAFYGHFMTDVVIKLAGYDIPEGAEGKLFFHPETHSVVIPAEHFARYYRNHGGWDLDDSAMVIIRKINGNVKAIIVRSPNSWGEYSMIDVHLDGLPLFFTYGDIPELDEADLPTQIQDLVLDDPQKDRSLPSGTFVREAEYGYRDFDYALDCAVINPGTGSLINLLCIAFNAIFGTYNRDPFAETEDVVDTTQQNPSLEGLLALLVHRDNAKGMLLDALLSGQPVDRLIFERRLNLSDKDKASLRGQIRIVDGLFSQTKHMVLEEIKLYNGLLEELAVNGRVQMDFSGIDFSSVKGTETAIWEGFRTTSASARRIVLPEEQRMLWQGYNRALVVKLLATPEARRDLVLLNYLNWCYQEGKNDSALFGTPAVTNGEIEVSVLDLLLAALVRRGLAQPYGDWDHLTDLVEEAEEA